uniref:ATP synthase subunit b, chloroplastic n=1 Tax=Rhipilia penicilloides TaxID=1979422 RepID=A0A2P0QHM3_9CHLO|nr:ATP synthase CF0 subunit I [Rhipilia penicilloides]ARO74267.1 ATP synthase CF0 subunit I [Rhipilia penicilloides]
MIMQSWGIQTDIFETNIINLAVVIAIVVFFVGDAVKSLLSKRQESIFVNLEQAQQRAQQIEKIYLATQMKYQAAYQEVLEIRLHTEDTIKQQDKQYQIQRMKDLHRLQENQKITILYQQQKIQKQISQKILDFALQKVDQKFQQGLNSKIQKSVHTLSIQALKAFTIAASRPQ